MARILLVEDEAHLAYALSYNFQEEGYDVCVAGSIGEARAALSASQPDLIVLDAMLPDGDGMAFCGELRAAGVLTPVLALTARNTPPDIVAGLEAGADDYVGKPFVLAELLSRTAALLRRRTWNDVAATDVFEFGEHRVEFDTHRIVARGRVVNPTEMELKLLRYFIANENRVVSREDLLESVWGVSRRVETRTVDNFIVRLRRIFELDPARPTHFLTVRGVGYRFSSAGG